MRLPILVAALLAAVAQPLPAMAQPKAAASVGTMAAERRAVSQKTEFVGRMEAIERVELRARVTGFLQEVLFKEGDVVKEKSVLYRIEPESFQAAVQDARGSLLQAQARYVNATAQRERTEELVKTSAAAKATLDERIAAEKGAQGDVVTADANLKTAQINLGYTEIAAPITGEIGRSKLTRGNVVGPESGPLAVLVSRDPMYVTFPVSQREFLNLGTEDLRKSQNPNAGGALRARIRFSDGSAYDQIGRVDFVDVGVDRATDTVLVRATIANPRGVLIDGQLVRVSLETDKPEEKVLVPQAALIVDQQGTYVFVVVDGKAAVRRVKLGGENGAFVIVEEGLTGGEQVVVQGMETLRAGTPVLASPVTMPASRS